MGFSSYLIRPEETKLSLKTKASRECGVDPPHGSMKLEMMTVYNQIFLLAGRGCKLARWGIGKIRMTRWRATLAILP